MTPVILTAAECRRVQSQLDHVRVIVSRRMAPSDDAALIHAAIVNADEIAEHFLARRLAARDDFKVAASDLAALAVVLLHVVEHLALGVCEGCEGDEGQAEWEARMVELVRLYRLGEGWSKR